MLLEQVLHIMLNQDYPRSVIFRPQIYGLLHYDVLVKMENMGKKLCKRLQSHYYQPTTETIWYISWSSFSCMFGL